MDDSARQHSPIPGGNEPSGASASPTDQRRDAASLRMVISECERLMTCSNRATMVTGNLNLIERIERAQEFLESRSVRDVLGKNFGPALVDMKIARRARKMELAALRDSLYLELRNKGVQLAAVASLLNIKTGRLRATIVKGASEMARGMYPVVKGIRRDADILAIQAGLDRGERVRMAELPAWPEPLSKKREKRQYFRAGDEAEGEWTSAMTLAQIAAALKKSPKGAKGLLTDTGLIQKTKERWIVRIDNLGSSTTVKALRQAEQAMPLQPTSARKGPHRSSRGDSAQK